MTLGSPHKWVPDSNPPIGGYDINDSQIMSKSRSAIIKKPTQPYRRPTESNPEVGKYESSVHKQWTSDKSFTMGAPYQFVPDSNPGIGAYNIDDSLIKHNNRSTIIRKETSPYRRPKEREPEPGQYNASTHKLWTNGYLKDKKITLGAPYKFKPDENPGVGSYDVNESLISPNSKSTFIRKESSPYRRPKDKEPEPGQYNASTHKSWTNEYLKDKKISLGAPYQFKPDQNPPVGGYDVERGLAATQW